MFFAIGALASPLFVGRLVEAGVAWQSIILATCDRLTAPSLRAGLGEDPTRARDPGHRTMRRPTRAGGSRRAAHRLAVAVAATSQLRSACRPGSSASSSKRPSALRRPPSPCTWAADAGRLASDTERPIDHRRFAAAAALVASIALVFAALVPSLPPSIVLFGVVGFATGPSIR